MSRPEPGGDPARLDALLDGRAAPETDDERTMLALASQLRAAEPALPDGLERRIDDLLREEPKPTPRRPQPERRHPRGPSWWPRGGWRRLTLAFGPAAVAAAAIVVLVVQVGGPGSPGPPGSRASSELAPQAEGAAPAARAPEAEAPGLPATAPADSSAPPRAAPVAPPPPAPPPAAPRAAPSGLAPIAATVRTGGAPLVLREGPGAGFPPAGRLRDGARVAVVCAETGTLQRGPGGAGERWLLLRSGAYAPQAVLVPDLSAAPDC